MLKFRQVRIAPIKSFDYNRNFVDVGQTGNEKWLVSGHATFNIKSQGELLGNYCLTAQRCWYETKVLLYIFRTNRRSYAGGLH